MLVCFNEITTRTLCDLGLGFVVGVALHCSAYTRGYTGLQPLIQPSYFDHSLVLWFLGTWTWKPRNKATLDQCTLNPLSEQKTACIDTIYIGEKHRTCTCAQHLGLFYKRMWCGSLLVHACSCKLPKHAHAVGYVHTAWLLNRKL